MLLEQTRDGFRIAVGRLVDDQVVAGAILLLEEEAGAVALQLPVHHDGDAVSEQIGFVHEVRG